MLGRNRDRVFLVWSSHECADRGKDALVQKLDQGDVLTHCDATVCSFFVQWLTENSLSGDVLLRLGVDVWNCFETVHHIWAVSDWIGAGIWIVLRCWFKFVCRAVSLRNAADSGGIRCATLRDQGGFVSKRRG